MVIFNIRLPEVENVEVEEVERVETVERFGSYNVCLSRLARRPCKPQPRLDS